MKEKMDSNERNSRFLVICRIPDQGAFSHLIILRVAHVRPPFLLAHCAQLQILILGHIGFMGCMWLVLKLRCDLSSPQSGFER